MTARDDALRALADEWSAADETVPSRWAAGRLRAVLDATAETTDEGEEFGLARKLREERTRREMAESELEAAHIAADMCEAECKRLREELAERDKFRAAVQQVYGLQCPPLRSSFADDDFGKGAWTAHHWWSRVLGGALSRHAARPAVAVGTDARLTDDDRESLGDDGPCQACGQPYPAWRAPDDLWNLVMGGPDATSDPGGFLCPTCFLRRGDERAPIRGAWVVGTPVRPERVVKAEALREATDDVPRLHLRPEGVRVWLRDRAERILGDRGVGGGA